MEPAAVQSKGMLAEDSDKTTEKEISSEKSGNQRCSNFKKNIRKTNLRKKSKEISQMGNDTLTKKQSVWNGGAKYRTDVYERTKQ